MISISEARTIVERPEIADALDKYKYIMENLYKTDVSDNEMFKGVFCDFYRLKECSSQKIRTQYFSILEQIKGQGSNVSFKSVFDLTRKVERNNDPSLASKLAHTINPELPLWDKTVTQDYFGIKRPRKIRNPVEKYSECYEEYKNRFSEYMESEEGISLIQVFDWKFPNAGISNVKKLEFIISHNRDGKKRLRNSYELWLQLSRLAEFDDSAYDQELKNSIASELNLDAGNIGSELKKRDVSTDRLLVAVLASLEPFSKMLADLENLYIMAGACSNNNNIEVEFGFEERALLYSLDKFRKEIKEIQERIIWKKRLISLEELVKSIDSIRTERHWNDFTYYTNRYKNEGFYDEACTQIKTWILRNGVELLSDHLPKFPQTQCKLLNAKIKNLVEIVDDYYQRDRRKPVPYCEMDGGKLSRRVKDCEYLSCPIDSFHLYNCFVFHFCRLVTYFNGKIASGENADRFIRIIDEILSDQKIFTTDTQFKKYNSVYEILEMPFWKHRHEMYSAWVFKCIADAVSDLGIQYNVIDGILQIKFSGGKLATILLPGIEFEIWVEKRYSAKNPEGRGRANGIQPDYSLMRRIGENAAPCALVECKQYRKPSIKNFRDAVNDYGMAIPEARVFLVNYGQIPKSLKDHLKSEVKQRYVGYGQMRPGTSTEFTNDVRHSIKTVWSELLQKSQTSLAEWEAKFEQFRVELFWQSSPIDLDLEVIIRIRSNSEGIAVRYYNRVGTDQFPYAKLVKDTVKGPGNETINIERIISGYYDIYIHNFTGEIRIDGAIKVKITAGNEYFCVYRSGVWERGSKWFVGSFNSIGFIEMDRWVPEK